MADHLELWTSPDGEGPPAEPPDDSTGSEPGKSPRERGPFVTYLSMPWSYGDRHSSDRWHRLQCRLGRHDMHGGHVMQVEGAVVFIERRCRWCEAEAGSSGGP